VIRRTSAAQATAWVLAGLTSIGLSSCATVDRNDVAAKVGASSLSPTNVQTLAATGGTATGDELRSQITRWIRTTVLEEANGQADVAPPATSAELDTRYAKAIAAIAGPEVQDLYELGVNGSPAICLAAITSTSLEEANNVLTQLNNGTPFADAARANSTDVVIAQAGGIVRGGVNGDQECLDPTTINNPPLIAALGPAVVGVPFVAELGTFSAVLMLRPFDELLPESQTLIASSIVPQERLDTIVDDADIYVDPRYGRWDPASGSVVALTS
jgi:hypothetical protein